MPRRPRQTAGTASPGARLGGWVLAAAAAVALGGGLETAWTFRAPLAELLGGAATAWEVALLFALVATLAALVLRARRPAAMPSPGLQARLAVHVLALGTVAYMLWLEPVRGPVASMFLGACAGAWSALLLALAGRSPRALRVVGRVDLALVLLLALVLGAETALRLWDAYRPSPLLATEGGTAEQHIVRETLPPGTIVRGFPVNSRGDYDTEPAASPGRRVVTVGDSFSYGVVPWPRHFTTVAEERLDGVDVYNMGRPTLGPREYLHLVEHEVPDLDPDVVVVNVFVGNDVNQARNRDSWDGGAWVWLDPGRWLVVLAATRWGAVSGQAVAEEDVPVASTGERVGWAAGDPRIDELVARAGDEWPWLDDPALERTMMTPETFLGVETTRARRTCSGLTVGYDMLLDLLDETRAAAAPARFAVMIIPDEFQVEEALWDDIVANTPGEALRRLQAQELLVPALTERGVPVLDLLPVLRAEPTDAEGRRRLYHLRDTHLNARGNRVAGEALAAFLDGLLGEP